MTTTEEIARLSAIVLECEGHVIYTVTRHRTRRAGAIVVDPFVIQPGYQERGAGHPARLVNIRPLAVAARFAEHRTERGVVVYAADPVEAVRFRILADVVWHHALERDRPGLLARFTHWEV